VIRVQDAAGNVMETHQHAGDFGNGSSISDAGLLASNCRCARFIFSAAHRLTRAHPRALSQRAGIARLDAEGDGLSGVTSDRESFAFISGAAGLVGGLPLRRAMNPWAMPEASR
jgi:hypothetical protein